MVKIIYPSLKVLAVFRSQIFSFAILSICLLAVSCSMISGGDKNKAGKINSLNTSLLAGYFLLNGGNNQVSNAPSVQRNSTYTVSKTTHVYAQGLSHSNWGLQ